MKVKIFLAGILILFQAVGFVYAASKPVLVLDPGHGGLDNGVRGPAGTFEKTAVLAFATRIRVLAGDRFTILFTRNEDYDLSLTDRTTVANRAKADLFISLHTGGGYTHTAGGATIFFHQTGHGTDTEGGEEGTIPWERIAARHQSESRELAKRVKDFLKKVNAVKGHEIRIYGANLRVLQGADMPSILIEAGFLTNPDQERRFLDSRWQDRMGRAILDAAELFLHKMP